MLCDISGFVGSSGLPGEPGRGYSGRHCVPLHFLLTEILVG